MGFLEVSVAVELYTVAKDSGDVLGVAIRITQNWTKYRVEKSAKMMLKIRKTDIFE